MLLCVLSENLILTSIVFLPSTSEKHPTTYPKFVLRTFVLVLSECYFYNTNHIILELKLFEWLPYPSSTFMISPLTYMLMTPKSFTQMFLLVVKWHQNVTGPWFRNLYT